jgi:hypothetical protein
MERLSGQVLTSTDYNSEKGNPPGPPYGAALAFRLFLQVVRRAPYTAGNARPIALT